MKIRVKQKKGTYTTVVPGLIAMTLFFLFGGGIVLFSLWDLFSDFTFDNFIVVFSNNGIGTLFGLSFFLLSLYLGSYLFIPPKKYNAVLKSCKVEDINGKRICNYVFFITGNSDTVYEKYECYASGENNLVVGNVYGIGVKQFNWSVKYIGEALDEEKIFKDKSSSKGFNVVLYMFFLIFGGGIVFIVIKIFYDMANGVEIWPNFIGIIGCLMFFGPALYLYIVFSYENKSLDDKIEYDRKKREKKLKIIDSSKKLIPNTQYNGVYEGDFNSINSFRVNRAPFNNQDNYIVMEDQYESKLYRVVNENNRYLIKDKIDCVVGEIKLKKSDGVDVIFIPENDLSFMVYYKRDKNYGYKVIGREYRIKREKRVVILVKDNVEIAKIELNDNLTFPSGYVELDNVINSEEIMFICIGIIMIEYHLYNKSR